ncbi:CaiB/BaiF CoA transferase family protein [Sphingobium sp. B2]|uniref:CaiB/BaiF CoA transferase family protein n=1 Tax=Sphingobium sp. B2 TaxID=2583228 RepID=UPI0011A51513|nr:CoA transferase [Sphingobium sp. B2]
MSESGNRTLLQGIKVVDLTSIIFGPYCTQILADLGAEVIKVEPPEGDLMRRSGAHARTFGMGASHMTINRGKRSIVLNLKSEEGAEAMRRLVASSDIFIHNVRDKAISRLGFGYEAMRSINEKLIYVHCVGYGSDGPYADLPAYDDVIQAASGLASLPCKVDGNPAPRYTPSTVVDKVAGLYAAYAVMAAYIHRLRTGEGQSVEVPMFEAFTQFLLEEHLAGATFDPPQGSAGYRRQIEPFRQPFRTSDGYISIVPYGDANWIKVLELLDDAAFLSDERLATPALRVANADLLYERLGQLTQKWTTAQLDELCRLASIPVMPVRDIAEIQDDPHLRATGFFKRREHPSEGGYFEVQPPVRFSAGAPEIGHAPRLGEHTDEILAEIGMSQTFSSGGGAQ